MPATLETEPPPRPRLYRGRIRPTAGRRALRALLRLTIALGVAGLALTAGKVFLYDLASQRL